jgi:hypothetical protein
VLAFLNTRVTHVIILVLLTVKTDAALLVAVFMLGVSRLDLFRLVIPLDMDSGAVMIVAHADCNTRPVEGFAE